MSIWISENDRTLLQWNLSSRANPERGPLDYEALGNGRLVAVEGFLHPIIIRWQRRDRLALHRFNEGRLYALPNCLMLRRLCLRLFDISRRADLKRPD